jgi:hypothetical protein
LPEIHFYDRDNDHHYADAIAAVNGRGLPNWGALTEKREIENYLDSDAIKAATGFEIAVDDDSDIPLALARTQHEAAIGAKPWADVSDEDVKKKSSRAKKRLCCEAAALMTIEQLRARDANNQIEELLVRISEIATT